MAWSPARKNMKMRGFPAKISHFEAILKSDNLKFELNGPLVRRFFTGSLERGTTPLGSNGSVLLHGLKF